MYSLMTSVIESVCSLDCKVSTASQKNLVSEILFTNIHFLSCCYFLSTIVSESKETESVLVAVNISESQLWLLHAVHHTVNIQYISEASQETNLRDWYSSYKSRTHQQDQESCPFLIRRHFHLREVSIGPPTSTSSLLLHNPMCIKSLCKLNEVFIINSKDNYISKQTMDKVQVKLCYYFSSNSLKNSDVGLIMYQNF